MGKQEDQVIVEQFLDELTLAITKRYAKKIDFIILFGSAARGEFIRKVSDIDLVIQVLDELDVMPIQEFATKRFWALDKKHKTGFDVSCSLKRPSTLLGRILRRFEKKAHLYTPLFVFGPKDMDWENGRVKKKDLAIGATLIASQASIFYNFKHFGKIYYGRDIRKVINPNLTVFERLKAILTPAYLAFGGLCVSLFLPESAVKYCTKAILYEVDSALMFVHRLKTSKRHLKKKELKKVTEFHYAKSFVALDLDVKYKSLQPKHFIIIDDALRYKREGFDGRRRDALVYAAKAMWFIYAINTIVILKRVLKL